MHWYPGIITITFALFALPIKNVKVLKNEGGRRLSESLGVSKSALHR